MSRKRAFCLMYHDVYKEQKNDSGFCGSSADTYKIKEDVFEEQIKSISRWLQENNKSHSEVRLTFDDGGSSFYYHIAPLLEKYSFVGYFFIATKYIGKNGFLTESQIKELVARGHIIGGHSHTHRQMMNSLSYAELEQDWTDCQVKLSNIIGHSIQTCSLPCGFMSNEMLDALLKVGFSEIYTSEPTCYVAQYKGATLYGRYGVKDGMSCKYILNILRCPFVRVLISMKKIVLNSAKVLLGRYYIKIRETIINVMKSKKN
jgi:hypothetical protein